MKPARAQQERHQGAVEASGVPQGGATIAAHARSLEQARCAREHRFELEQRQIASATEALARIIETGKGLTLKQIEGRALLVLQAAMTGQVVVPPALLDAVKAMLEHVRWSTEMKKGKPRQRTDLSVQAPPVKVFTGMKERKPASESRQLEESTAQVVDVAALGDSVR